MVGDDDATSTIDVVHTKVLKDDPPYIVVSVGMFEFRNSIIGMTITASVRRVHATVPLASISGAKANGRVTEHSSVSGSAPQVVCRTAHFDFH